MQEKTLHELIDELKALQIREARIVALLERAAAADQESTTPTEHGFIRGDRIRILKITKPSGWGNTHWNYHQARIATVTHTTAERVYFVTDNGLNTWRLPKNVIKL
jgi:hypothetical protein